MGIQPIVAITLVELGLPLAGVYTALNAEKGMTLLQEKLTDHIIDDSEADREEDDQPG